MRAHTVWNNMLCDVFWQPLTSANAGVLPAARSAAVSAGVDCWGAAGRAPPQLSKPAAGATRCGGCQRGTYQGGEEWQAASLHRDRSERATPAQQAGAYQLVWQLGQPHHLTDFHHTAPCPVWPCKPCGSWNGWRASGSDRGRAHSCG